MASRMYAFTSLLNLPININVRLMQNVAPATWRTKAKKVRKMQASLLHCPSMLRPYRTLFQKRAQQRMFFLVSHLHRLLYLLHPSHPPTLLEASKAADM